MLIEEQTKETKSTRMKNSKKSSVVDAVLPKLNSPVPCLDDDEPILKEEENRFVLFPIRYPEM